VETGKHYNYYRDYDSSLGRYLQSDPIGLKGGISTYTYVDSRPLELFDAWNSPASPDSSLRCAGLGVAAQTQNPNQADIPLKDLKKVTE